METPINYNLNDSSINGNVTAPPIAPDLPSWSVTVFIAYSIVIMVLGVIGNGVIVIVEAHTKHRSSTDWLVTFMSVNDLILAGCNTPIYILLFNGSWKDVGSGALCGLMEFVQETCSFSSTLLLTVTAIDRYLKTSRPHSKGITPQRALYICVGVTVFTVTLCMPIPFYVLYDEQRKCRYDQSDPTVMAAFLVLQFILQATFLIMFLVVIASYCKIAHTIRVRIKKFAQSGLTPSGSLEGDSKRPRFLRRNKIAPSGGKNSDCIEQSNSRCRNGLETSFSMAMTPVSGPNTIVSCNDVSQIQQTNIDTSQTQQTNIDTSQTQQTNIDTSQTQQTNRSAHSSDTHASVQKQRLEQGVKVNKTTIIMFAVTAVFILSWIPPWVAAILWPPTVRQISVTEMVGYLFCRRSFMINTCTNPLFYIGMSTLFRNNTKQTLSKLCKVFRRRS